MRVLSTKAFALITALKLSVSADSDAPEILNTIREQFGRDDLFVVLIDGDIRSESYVKNLQDLESAIKGMTFEFDAATTVATPSEVHASENADEDWGGDDWGDESGEMRVSP